jgi:hypothetical protein
VARAKRGELTESEQNSYLASLLKLEGKFSVADLADVMSLLMQAAVDTTSSLRCSTRFNETENY